METTKSTSPRVYVGTWKKYNEGSLKGRWIDLADFSTYDDFLRYCGVVHSDERDPEFMIQDCENFPDGLGVTEWLSREDFQDVKEAMNSQIEEQVRLEVGAPSWEIVDYSEKALAVIGDTRPISGQLKALGGRFNARLSCGPGWIFSKRKEAEVRQALAGAPVQESSTEAVKPAFADALPEWLATMKLPSDREYYKKHSAGAIKVPEGYIVIDKPRIENRFCFHDEGPDYETYKEIHRKDENLRAYFLNENLRDLDTELEHLRKEDTPVFVYSMDYKQMAGYRTDRYSYDFHECMKAGHRQMTPEERAQVIALTQAVRDAFEKRLQTYLKKYGTSKIHTWTYWADA